MTEIPVKKEKKSLWCDQCKTNKCYEGYADGKPDYCQAAASPEIMEGAHQTYTSEEVAKFQLASSKLLKRQREAGGVGLESRNPSSM